MGLLVILEGNRAMDLRLRKALRPLAGFGIVHGIHEWVEMFEQMEILIGHNEPLIPEFVRLALLAVSFVSLIAFGTYLLAYTESAQRVIILVPLGLEAIWVFGLITFRGHYPSDEIWGIADVWTRYTLAIPGGLLAAIGLVAQQRVFRRSGLVRFGQDALWAAVAFAWYGVAGQFFVKATSFPPSNIINQDVFLELFGFPVQLFRAAMAIAAAIFVTRFLRAFQVESEQKIKELQEARLEEAQQRKRSKENSTGVLWMPRKQNASVSPATCMMRPDRRLPPSVWVCAAYQQRSRMNTIEIKLFSTLRDLEALTAGSLQELQRLIADLRPSHLDDLGLLATIRWYVNDFKARSNLDIEIIISGEEKTICPEYSTSIFRIMQEALTNITKHAEATKVQIHIIFDPEEVRIAVEDNGRGFDTHEIKKQKSWGLIGMEERVTLLDGKFYLHSGPGNGTMVEIVIPYCPIHREAAQ